MLTGPWPDLRGYPGSLASFSLCPRAELWDPWLLIPALPGASSCATVGSSLLRKPPFPLLSQESAIPPEGEVQSTELEGHWILGRRGWGGEPRGGPGSKVCWAGPFLPLGLLCRLPDAEKWRACSGSEGISLAHTNSGPGKLPSTLSAGSGSSSRPPGPEEAELSSCHGNGEGGVGDLWWVSVPGRRRSGARNEVCREEGQMSCEKALWKGLSPQAPPSCTPHPGTDN